MEYVTCDGTEVPAVGLGTWEMEPSTARRAVEIALDLGYRHIDTAQAYGNERAVGNAIAAAAVDREEVFLTTKVDAVHRTFDGILESVAESVAKLGVGAVDLLLIHWPNPIASLRTIIPALDAAVDRGLARHIGVSNFGRDRLAQARRIADHPIVTDQVLFHPWYPQRDLLRYCQDEGVVLTAYSPLANGAALDDDLLAAIGRRYGKSAAQVALRWATQHENVMTIPMSTSREHLAENIDIFDFRLTAAEHDRLTRPSLLKTGYMLAQAQL